MKKQSGVKTKSLYKRGLKNGRGKLKCVLIILLAVLPLVVFGYLHTIYTFAVTGALVFSLIASLVTCVYVLSTNKNGQSKAVWIIFLLVCFTFGYIIFWLSDERIFFKKNKLIILYLFVKIFSQIIIIKEQFTRTIFTYIIITLTC